MADPVEQVESIDVSKLFHVIYSKSTGQEDKDVAAELAIPELVKTLSGDKLKSIANNNDLSIGVRMQAIEAVIANPDFINAKIWSKGKCYAGQDTLLSRGMDEVKDFVLASLTLGAEGFINHFINYDNWGQMKSESAKIKPDIAKMHVELVAKAFLASDLKNDKKLCLSILKNKYGPSLFGEVVLKGTAVEFNSAYVHLFTADGRGYDELWRTNVSAATPPHGVPREKHKPLRISIPEGNFTITTREVGEFSTFYHYDVHAQVSNRFSLTPEQYKKLESNEQVAMAGKDGKQYLLVKGYVEIKHVVYPCCRIYRNSTLIPKDVENAAADTFIDGKDSKGYNTEDKTLLSFAATGIFDTAYRERAGKKGLEWQYEGHVVASQDYPPQTLEMARQKIAHYKLETIKPLQEKWLAENSKPGEWQKILESSKAEYRSAESVLKHLSEMYYDAQSNEIKTGSFRLLDALFKAEIDHLVEKGEDHLISLFSNQGWLGFKMPEVIISYANAEKWDKACLNFLEMHKDIVDFPSRSVADSLHGMAGYSYGGERYHDHLSPDVMAKAKVLYDAIIERQNLAATAELKKAVEKRQTVVALGANQPTTLPGIKQPGQQGEKLTGKQ